MANVTAETHHRIVTGIARSKHEMVATRNATTIRPSYLNFEFAMKLLTDCQSAIEDERDQDRIAFMLRNADIGLSMFEAGAASDAVQRARQDLKELSSGI